MKIVRAHHIAAFWHQINRGNLDVLRAVREIRLEQVQDHTSNTKPGIQTVSDTVAWLMRKMARASALTRAGWSLFLIDKNAILVE